MRKTEGSARMDGKIKFCFRHIKLEMPIRHSGEEVK